MKIIKTSWFPFGKFTSINLFGTLFTKLNKVNRYSINHESIHSEQARDLCRWSPLGYTLYYILYFLMWIIELVRPPYSRSYYDTIFEKEAYLNQYDMNYLKTRKRFACWKKMYWNNKEFNKIIKSKYK